MIPPLSGRWTAARKAELVKSVHANKIQLNDVLAMGVSWHEWLDWEYAESTHNPDRLKSTYIQKFRKAAATSGL